jgi:hypothetical protein
MSLAGMTSPEPVDTPLSTKGLHAVSVAACPLSDIETINCRRMLYWPKLEEKSAERRTAGMPWFDVHDLAAVSVSSELPAL